MSRDQTIGQAIGQYEDDKDIHMDQDIARRISSGLSPCQENGQRTRAMHIYCAYMNLMQFALLLHKKHMYVRYEIGAQTNLILSLVLY